jgi:hypothetical protein
MCESGSETAGSNRLLLIDPSLPQTRNEAHETGFDRPEEFSCHLIERIYTECLQIAGIQCTSHLSPSTFNARKPPEARQSDPR